MAKLNSKAKLALEQTIQLWTYMLEQDVTKDVAMQKLFPEHYDNICCNCFLCEYTRPYHNPEVDSYLIEYNCAVCPASLACNEPNSYFNNSTSNHTTTRQQAINSIINSCITALNSEDN